MPRPPLPEDRPGLPRGARKEIERVAGTPGKAKEVIAAVAFGGERLENDDTAGALTYLLWARQEAGTAACVRELTGIALYLDGQFEEARKELQTYRRISQSPDQNHLLADCLRAVGRGTDQIPALVEAMADAPADRRVEGRIVWASHVADQGDVIAALHVLTPVLREDPEQIGEEALVRLWYVAGDLAERAGRTSQAVEWFEKVVDAGDPWDAEERLADLQ